MARRERGDPRHYTAAVIGCGRVGSLLARDKLRNHPCTHAGIYRAHQRVNLVAGCDINASRREEFARDWEISESNVYTDYAKMLEEIKPDIVSIATYTESHAEITIAAANAGVSIILCEKPMARTLEEADRMIEACRVHGAALGIHHERRWSRVFREAKRIIESGEIGEVRTVIGNVLTGAPNPDWHARPEISGGGPTLHDGTHLFDAIRFLCGEIVEIHGRTRRNNPELRVEDTGYAMMRLGNGGVAFVECGGRRKYFNFELDIQCSRGRIQIGNAILRLWAVGPSPRYEGFTEFTEKDFPVSWQRDDYFPFVVDELIGAFEEDRSSLSDGREGRAALEAVLKVYSGGEVD